LFAVTLAFFFASYGADDDSPHLRAIPRSVAAAEATRRELRERRDLGLIRRITVGDGEALDELLRAHAQPLFNVAFRTLGDQALAQDVVQELFVHLWMSRGSLEVRGSVAAYLTRAARNRALNLRVHERSQRNIEARTRAVYDGLEPSILATGEAELLNAEFRAALVRALSTLSPRLRDVFLLRADQDLSYAEIAEVLDVSIASVRTQMYRATERLAAELSEWQDR
jgi:RNA polymerase sigma-70 factor (ECF subfamily)